MNDLLEFGTVGMKTLLERYRFAREVNPPALAYHLARNQALRACKVIYYLPEGFYLKMLREEVSK